MCQAVLCVGLPGGCQVLPTQRHVTGDKTGFDDSQLWPVTGSDCSLSQTTHTLHIQSLV